MWLAWMAGSGAHLPRQEEVLCALVQGLGLFLPSPGTGKNHSEQYPSTSFPTLHHQVRSWIREMLSYQQTWNELWAHFFSFPFHGREREKKSNCTWLPFLDLQQIPLDLKNNAGGCRQEAQERLYTKVEDVFFRRRAGVGKGVLDNQNIWQLRTQLDLDCVYLWVGQKNLPKRDSLQRQR